jgi:hypothetical protein
MTDDSRLRWFVTPTSRQPVPLRETADLRKRDHWPVYAFDTFGEAWTFLLLRWARFRDLLDDETNPPRP